MKNKHTVNWLDLLPSSGIHTVSLAPQQLLFREGDKPKGIYYLAEGEVLLDRMTAAGESVSIHRATANTTFAEASLFSTQMHCRAMATQACQLRLAPKLLVLEQLHHNGEFSLAFCASLARDVQHARRRSELLSIRGASDRVLAAFSTGQAERSIHALAADIALTPEATSRAIRQLCQQGKLQQLGRARYALASNNNDQINHCNTIDRR